MTPLQLAMTFTLRPDVEGAWTPIDGGTMHGVKQSIYDAYRHSKDLPLQSVRLISDDEVNEIILSEYWRPARCDMMPTKLAVCMFDIAYNGGPDEAIKLLQHALGIEADGIYGSQTDATMHNTLALETPDAPHGLVARFLDARRAFYHNLVIKDAVKYQQYLDGWLNRVDSLEAYIKTL